MCMDMRKYGDMRGYMEFVKMCDSDQSVNICKYVEHVNICGYVYVNIFVVC